MLTASHTTSYIGQWETLFAVALSGQSETETASGLSAGRPTPADQRLHSQLTVTLTKNLMLY